MQPTADSGNAHYKMLEAKTVDMIEREMVQIKGICNTKGDDSNTSSKRWKITENIEN